MMNKPKNAHTVMQKIYIIGTIHGQTPHDQLEAVIENIGPDQLLVEMPDEPVEELKKREVYPDEMVFIWQWAKENDISRASFEVEEDHDPLKEDIDEDHPKYKKFLEKDKENSKKYSWKEANHKEVNRKPGEVFDPEIFDLEAIKQREKQMVENIKEALIDEGRVVIITGASHLDYFSEHLPNTTIPLRN